MDEIEIEYPCVMACGNPAALRFELGKLSEVIWTPTGPVSIPDHFIYVCSFRCLSRYARWLASAPNLN